MNIIKIDKLGNTLYGYQNNGIQSRATPSTPDKNQIRTVIFQITRSPTENRNRNLKLPFLYAMIPGRANNGLMTTDVSFFEFV